MAKCDRDIAEQKKREEQMKEDAWLDGDCEDSELRSYILGGRCSQHEEMSDDEIDREAERAIDEYEAEFGADGYRAFPGNREV